MAATKEVSFVLLILSYLFYKSESTLTIRGVSLTKLPLYDSSKDFTCLDGSLTIPFSSINDDFCDCRDGSDEPGTAACPDGFFHCTNAGYKPRNVPSSRVNDGICDCCDGSDEYQGKANCPTNCKELYKLEFEKRRQDIELAKQGLAKKQELSEQGKQTKEQKKQKLEELKQQLEGKSKEVDDLRVSKEEAEAAEKELKDKHEKDWEEKKNKILAERDRVAAEAAFWVLDADSSSSITVHEIVETHHLDKVYTEEEAKELLGGNEEVDMNKFTQELWNTIKDKYKEKEEPPKEDKNEEVPPTEIPTEPPIPIPPSAEDIDDNPDVPDVEGDQDDDDDDDEEEDKNEPVAPTPAPTPSDDSLDAELKMPDYDEETKAKIDLADKARKDFDSAESDKKNIEREISDIDKMLEMDYGEHDEFLPLSGQCYELTDREYTYKLCPFDKATQQPKNGGSETSLGTWGEWTGEPTKYMRMKYKGGQNCWNGPDRSTEVILSCGSETQLTSVSEPSRCEYRMEFKAPSACHEQHTMLHDHQEL